MAKRDLDKEFKEQLGKAGPFQFSENNWKAASAMLEKEIPVTSGGRFFNLTTVLLSITVVLLLGTTLILSLEKNTTQEQNAIEMPLSESHTLETSPDVFEIQDPSTDDLKTIENENKRPIVKSNSAGGSFKTSSENQSDIDNSKATVNISSKKTNKDNNALKTKNVSAISKSENEAEKPQDINSKQTNGIKITSNSDLKQSETVQNIENNASGQTALPSGAEASAIAAALSETSKNKIENSKVNEKGSGDHSLNSKDGKSTIELGAEESQKNKTFETIAGAGIVNEGGNNDNTKPISKDKKGSEDHTLNSEDSKTTNESGEESQLNKTSETIAGAALIFENQKKDNTTPDANASKSTSIESASIDKTSNSEENQKPSDKLSTASEEESNSSIPDAAKRRNPKNPRYNSNYFKMGFETGLFTTNRTLITSDLNCEDYVIKRNNEESMKPSYSFGLNFGQQIDKLSWQVGLNYSTYQENIVYNNEILGLDVLDNGYWNQFNSIDTTVRSNWVIDSIFKGHWEFDTTYTNSIDSNYIEQWDTSTVVKLDSSIQQNNGIHNLSYFEVPLFVGYTFGKNNWLFDLQPGMSIGFLSGSRGSRYIDKNLSGLVEPAYNLEQFNTVIWKAHVRVGVRYAFENWELGLYPHYSYTLNNVLNSTKVDQQFGNFGVSIGAYYKL